MGVREVGRVSEVVQVSAGAEVDVSGSRKQQREEIGVVGAEDGVGADGGGRESWGRR